MRVLLALLLLLEQVLGFVLVLPQQMVRLIALHSDTFDDCEEKALKLCKEGNYADALPLFEQSLELPGDGFDIVRVQRTASPVGGAPVLRDLEETRFPSNEQKQTSYFNIAACHAQLGDDAKALDAIETALSLGFDDFELLTSDADFANLQSDIARLITKYKQQNNAFPSLPSSFGLPSFGSLFGGSSSKNSD
mmetsp:Transcript_11513/g.15719  ORF Transcript_11513/g.15719 Transcript_11513/m.15719 type:complete len:193 (+) Transcript_11513:45-623(+)|eukprot:CAMPEP_0197302778 /NCGR_PEP_ID=MMETSP0890-20130614/51262_1 /TAXON_ID=44058 ORGANISM="Aureoumbra lagunensis, Strain CCMP1510" /NCGR_SAMPLE_ID=MMETSP0890 /ASSEMBLY_ACC=CAM_ASM_000533 /LENGTH=192 /DNA_ID=CAMNT_0042782469 /DNA_START=44 /DNA_END=622 /DNA_ORIENTATION=-